MRVVTYSRVSTDDKGQKPEVQVEELRRYCAARGWTIIEEIVDEGFSGGTDKRPGLKRLTDLVRSRQVDVVAVTKLDRFARSMRHLITALDEFTVLGVLFVSVSDQIDLTTASGKLMMHLLAAFAEFERGLVSERTMLGLAHARRKGKRLGRPQRHDPDEIRRLRNTGLSYREIARNLNVPMGTITSAIRGAQKTPSKVVVSAGGNSRT